MIPEEFLAKINRGLDEKLKETKEIIRQNQNCCIAWDGSWDSNALVYIALQVNPNIPIIFIDTGVSLPGLLDWIKKVALDWHIKNFHILKPEMSFWDMPEDTQIHVKGCCKLLLINTSEKFMLDNNISKILIATRWQDRKAWKMFLERGIVDTRFVGERIYPLAWWNQEQMEEFHQRENLPRNPLYQKYSRVNLCYLCPLLAREELEKNNSELLEKRNLAKTKFIRMYEWDSGEKRKEFFSNEFPDWLVVE